MRLLQLGIFAFVFIVGVGFFIKNNIQENTANDFPAKLIKKMEVKNGWSIDNVVRFEDYIFEVETAETTLQKTKGLSNRKTFPKNHAMLFVFSNIGSHGFWMKDMYLSIDIVWLDEYKKVVHMEEKVSPDTFPQVFKNDKESKYVLEFEEGTVEKVGIKIGSQFDF